MFVRYAIDRQIHANGSGVAYTVAKGLMPRGGMVRLLIRVLNGVKGS